jgi:hypothetical protein
VDNKYCGKYRHVPVKKKQNVLIWDLVTSTMASASRQLSLDPHHLSCDNEQYLTPTDVAKTTPRRSDRAARLLTATRLCLNSPLEVPMSRGQINPNVDHYHSNPMEISSTFSIPDITD